MAAMTIRRALLGLACLLGAAGVAAAASSAHGGGTQLAPAAQMLLTHAGSAVALLVAFQDNRAGLLSVALMEGGVALFSADMASRALRSEALFPAAAPVGGALVIAAWFLAALVALLRR